MVFKVSSLFKNIPLQQAPPKKTRAKSLPAPPKLKINIPENHPVKKRKAPIPTALREAVWIHHMGRSFEGKCRVPWCPNTITAFEFQCGHNIPESKGGPTKIENLVPICSRCNLSMGDRYTITEWGSLLHIPNNGLTLRVGSQEVALTHPSNNGPPHPSIPSVPVVEPPKKKWCC